MIYNMVNNHVGSRELNKIHKASGFLDGALSGTTSGFLQVFKQNHIWREFLAQHFFIFLHLEGKGSSTIFAGV